MRPMNEEKYLDGGFLAPGTMNNADGEERRVGVELEFAGLDLDGAVDAVVEVFGGTVEKSDSFWRKVETQYGSFSVEMDASVLKQREYERYFRMVGVEPGSGTGRELERLLGSLSREVVPCEVAAPPLPLSRLPMTDDLRAALAQRRAKGTKQSVFYAFGLHLNVEPWSLETDVLLDHLKGFLLLAPWLRGEVDATRSIAPYVRDFPETYVRLVLDPAYRGIELQRFMTDYMEANPTRNRPLDMTPLFSFLDAELLESLMPDTRLISGRPAFHYRLPDCRVDDPQWTIAEPWNQWVHLERLAADRALQDSLAAEYLERPLPDLGGWAARMQEWLDR